MKRFLIAVFCLLIICKSLVAANATLGGVTLGWNYNPELDVIGYKIYYGTNSGQYIQSIDATNTNKAYIVVSGIELTNSPDAKYIGDFIWSQTNWPEFVYFAATAYNSSSLESDFSNEVIIHHVPNDGSVPNMPKNFLISLYIPSVPKPPSSFNIISGDKFNNISWGAVGNASMYHVKRSLNSGGPYTEIVTVFTNNYNDLGLVNGTTYYYIITSENNLGESEESFEISGTPFISLSFGTPGVISANGLARPNWSSSSNTNILISLNSFGENRLALAFANSFDFELDKIESVLFAGQPMRRLFSTNAYTIEGFAEIYYLTNPPVGNNLVMETVTTTGDLRELSLAGVILTNVNLNDIFGQVSAVYYNSSTSSPEVIVEAFDNSLVIDYLSGASYNTSPRIPNEGQTLVTKAEYIGWFSGYVSSKNGSNGNVNMGWSVPSYKSTIIGVAIKGF